MQLQIDDQLVESQVARSSDFSLHDCIRLGTHMDWLALLTSPHPTPTTKATRCKQRVHGSH